MADQHVSNVGEEEALHLQGDDYGAVDVENGPAPEISPRYYDFSWSKPKVILSGLLLLILFITVDLKLCASGYSEAVIVDVKSVELHNGPQLSMDMSFNFEFEYDQIRNWWKRVHLKAISRSLDVIEFTIDKPMIFSINGKNMVIVKGSEQRFNIAMRPNVVNEVVLKDLDLDLDPTNVAQFINGVFAESIKDLHIGCITRVNFAYLHGATLRLDYGLRGLNLQSIVRQFEDQLVFEGTGYTFDGTEANGTLKIGWPDISELELLKFDDIPSINWDLELYGCDRKTKVLEARNDPFSIAPENTTVDVAFTIPPLPDSVQQKCSSGYSPVNKALREILADQKVSVVISGSIFQPGLYDWMAEIVSLLEIPFAARINNSQSFSTPNGVSVDRIEIGLVEDELALNSSVTVGLDQDIHMDVTDISGILGIKSMCTLSLGQTETSLEESVFKMNMTDGVISIEDPQLLGDTINQALKEGMNIQLQSDINVSVDSPFISSSLDDLQASVEFGLPEADIGGLAMPNLTLNNVLLIEGTQDRLELAVDATVENPFDVSLDSSINPTVNFAYHGIDVGSLSIEPFHLDSLSKTNISTGLVLHSDPEKGKSRLEELVGRYVSGLEPEIRTNGGKVAESKQLTGLLDQIKVPLNVTQLDTSRESLFILSSTMHMLTSEVVLKVYNPISNHPVILDVLDGEASFQGTILGYITEETHLIVPPGVSTTRGIPVSYSHTGLGSDILRHAIDGTLVVDSRALLRIKLGGFALEVLYHGSGTDTKIRL